MKRKSFQTDEEYNTFREENSFIVVDSMETYAVSTSKGIYVVTVLYYHDMEEE